MLLRLAAQAIASALSAAHGGSIAAACTRSCCLLTFLQPSRQSVPHVDNLDGDGRNGADLGRVLTLVYYLNSEAWSDEDGGALRLFLPAVAARAEPMAVAAGAGDADASHVAACDVLPRGDVLALFRADATMHEVRPCGSQRLAASVWLLAAEEAPT